MKWTNEEIEFLKKNYRKLESKEIAKKLNRTEKSVQSKLYELKLNKKKFSEEEIKFIEDNIERSDEYLAKKLNRDKISIHRKVLRLKLERTNIVNASEVARILKVDTKTITRWKEKGLTMTKNNPKKINSPLKIRINSLLIFLGKNQDIWDSSKLDLYGLGIEPKWLIEKRKKDLKKIGYRCWSKIDDSRMIMLRNRGVSCKEVARELNRTENAISKRYAKLYNERKRGEVNAI
ncbi:hypothetical protein [uncultured Clostridium sp.]|uniref:hypothetical protein n=1 Tax=uncultured Clostridium sp. TaxID=59620 RepID=UPI00262694C4|nr:hypothetical protein [uncultured Clostridium sp.]